MGPVVKANVRRGVSATRACAFGVFGLSLALTWGCSASSATPTRGNGGSSNASGGTGTTALGGAPSEGGTPSGMGGAPANGGAPGNGGSTQGSGGTTSANGGSVSANGGTVTSANGGASSSGMTSAGGMACQMANYKFEPKIPTVFVMVDRSGSMFDCISTTDQTEPSCKTPDDTSWVKLKTATEAVIASLQAQVRFGFASFTGTNPQNGGKCPMIDQVAPALNNQAAIKTLYDSLPFQPETTESGKKFETPARQSLDMIGDELLKDTSPGDKYILFVTDGEPDYCDDANKLCAPDSVIAGLQALYDKKITTIVMGIKSGIMGLAPGILQAFANAGTGQPTLAPVPTGSDAFAFYDQCNGVAGWHADLVTSGKTAERGVTLGTYSTTGGTAKLYQPSVTDQAMLTSQLGAALAGVKSCTFDLSNVNGQSIKVDLNTLSAASVAIEGKNVAQDATNGWSMASASQLVLNGTSCDTWRSPDNNKIDFNFPCNTIIFE